MDCSFAIFMLCLLTNSDTMYCYRHPLWDRPIWRPAVFSTGLGQGRRNGVSGTPGKPGAGRKGWAFLHVCRVQRASETLKTQAEPYLPWSLEVVEAGWRAWRRPSSWNPAGGGSTPQSGRQSWWLRATPSTAPEAGGETGEKREEAGGRGTGTCPGEQQQRQDDLYSYENILSEPHIKAPRLTDNFFWFENLFIVNSSPCIKTKSTFNYTFNEPLLLKQTKII